MRPRCANAAAIVEAASNLVGSTNMSIRPRPLTNRDVHESASSILCIVIESAVWVTSDVLDVKVNVRFETLMLNADGRRRVVDMPGAVVLGCLAKEGEKTPAVYIQPIVGWPLLCDKDGIRPGRNFAHALIQAKMPAIIELAAGRFRIALQTKHPCLTIPLQLSEDQKKEMGFTVERKL